MKPKIIFILFQAPILTMKCDHKSRFDHQSCLKVYASFPIMKKKIEIGTCVPFLKMSTFKGALNGL